MNNEFGRFVETKRLQKGYSLRGFAEMIGIAPAYMSDLEKGHRPAPPVENTEILNNIALRLGLSNTDKEKMLDLAGKSRNAVSHDLPAYIMDDNRPDVRVALRMARDMDADNEVWKEVIRLLEDKKKKGE